MIGFSQKEQSLRDTLQREMEAFLAAYASEHTPRTAWGRPLIGYAGADHPYLRSLKTLISETHRMPEDYLEHPTVVMVYFLPFAPEVGRSNLAGEEPSEAWLNGYTETERMWGALSAHMTACIERMGCRAAAPTGIGRISNERIYSNWSMRHIAYAAGLGTFGINNMLITESGTCGRLNTLVTDLPFTPGEPLERENCLFKREGRCGACVRRCPEHALSTDAPFRRDLCFRRTSHNEAVYGQRACGKCVVGVPCTFRAP